jgi:hypothetical protein
MVDRSVVMCHEAAMQQFFTCGNNAVLLRLFFRLSSYCANEHVWMTGDSHCFSEEEDDTP